MVVHPNACVAAPGITMYRVVKIAEIADPDQIGSPDAIGNFFFADNTFGINESSEIVGAYDLHTMAGVSASIQSVATDLCNSGDDTAGFVGVTIVANTGCRENAIPTPTGLQARSAIAWRFRTTGALSVEAVAPPVANVESWAHSVTDLFDALPLHPGHESVVVGKASTDCFHNVIGFGDVIPSGARTILSAFDSGTRSAALAVYPPILSSASTLLRPLTFAGRD
ncbi:MAG: hypothetical protein SGJ09_08270 [Phycisphaerae bacterium]|nr:hypothetical protein [Phycisphaerae bacterium]